MGETINDSALEKSAFKLKPIGVKYFVGPSDAMDKLEAKIALCQLPQ